uniref:Carbonic anhydrase n=1 Tax=Lobosphaera incisa TaxID=312850 RepID=A0A0D5CPB4_9CHLO|nr:beta type carbonic anhydrase [Lobosphaera incisa]
MPRVKAQKPQGITDVLKNNQEWSKAMHESDPNYFSKLAHQQNPEYLWIGCSDSRVPANQILGLAPGEVFVQRNVGNQVTHRDMNCMSCIEYAVDALKVKHIIICGHYNCGAVRGALTLPGKAPGLVNLWITEIRDVRNANQAQLQELNNHDKLDRLCELNVIRQLFNVCTSPVVQAAWDRGQELSVHGLIYSVSDGLLRELSPCITSMTDLDTFEATVEEKPADETPAGEAAATDGEGATGEGVAAARGAAGTRNLRKSNTLKKLAQGFFQSMSTHLYFERTSVGADCSTPKAADATARFVPPTIQEDAAAAKPVLDKAEAAGADVAAAKAEEPKIAAVHPTEATA